MTLENHLISTPVGQLQTDGVTVSGTVVRVHAIPVVGGYHVTVRFSPPGRTGTVVRSAYSSFAPERSAPTPLLYDPRASSSVLVPDSNGLLSDARQQHWDALNRSLWWIVIPGALAAGAALWRRYRFVGLEQRGQGARRVSITSIEKKRRTWMVTVQPVGGTERGVVKLFPGQDPSGLLGQAEADLAAMPDGGPAILTLPSGVQFAGLAIWEHLNPVDPTTNTVLVDYPSGFLGQAVGRDESRRVRALVVYKCGMTVTRFPKLVKFVIAARSSAGAAGEGAVFMIVAVELLNLLVVRRSLLAFEAAVLAGPEHVRRRDPDARFIRAGAITAIDWTTTSSRRRRRILHLQLDDGSAVDFTLQPGMAGELEPAIAALTAQIRATTQLHTAQPSATRGADLPG